MTDTEEMDLLATMLDTGVPSGTYTDDRDFVDGIADALESSKRQVREWFGQKAIKYIPHKNFMVVRCGKKAGVLIRVKETAS